MNADEKQSLLKMFNALNTIQVKGEENMSLLLGCMNEIKKMVKGGEANGNSNPES